MTDTSTTWLTPAVVIALITALPAIVASVTALVVSIRSNKTATATRAAVEEVKATIAAQPADE